ncbi:MAG TPA: glycosyltransferase family 39 protein [Promineifilum sp.]|nr:glycosyltransferase family 39 protein [Promineifilum sp.]
MTIGEQGRKEERGKGSGGAPLLLRSPAPLLLIILLIAFALRAWNLNGIPPGLTGIPPGLTHDEANHGREAIGVLNGVYLYFFPLNYGSEPLYSYTVALFMALLGRGAFALRLVNVVFGTLTIAMTYAWASPRLGRTTALLAAALMAVSFWPLASSREALRVGMLPFFMVLAVIAFWRILETDDGRPQTTDHRPQTPRVVVRRPWSVVLFGLAVALTLHIYLAARVSWLLFPAFLAYLALFHRPVFRQSWRPIVAGLLLAGALIAPMFLYLRAHPEMQTRLDMFDGPLGAVRAGNFVPILLNVRDALLAFVWPGFGDQFLAYNIPGRPVLDAVSAAFFVAGLLVCLWRWRRPIHAFLLLWFLVGIIPSLVTGPTANTTRNMAALPAVYLIVAVGFVVFVEWLADRITNYELRITNEERAPNSYLVSRISYLGLSFVILFVVWVAFVSGRDYFVRWGQSAEVRGAYQHTLVESIRHVTANYSDAEPILFSTVYPGPAHDSSIALVMAADHPPVSETARWADARYALVLPPERTLAVVPYSTPPHPAFISLLEAIETVDLRPTDLDPRFTLYWLDGPTAAATLSAGSALAQPVDFNGAIELVAARWLAESARPGETAELLTVWRVLDSTRAGPVVPPSFTTDAVMFTHVLDGPVHDGAGGNLTQSDRLDAPSWAWRTGDVIAQIHPVVVPESAAAGEYAAVVGIYDRTSEVRLPVVGGGDTAVVPPLVVVP